MVLQTSGSCLVLRATVGLASLLNGELSFVYDEFSHSPGAYPTNPR